MERLKSISAIGLKPKHTIRINLVSQPDLNLEAFWIQNLSDTSNDRYWVLLPTKHLKAEQSYTEEEFKSLILIEAKEFAEEQEP